MGNTRQRPNDESANFGTYRSFEAKGYRFEADANKANFVISFSLGSRERIRVNNYPAPYRGNWACGGPYYQEVDVVTTPKGPCPSTCSTCNVDNPCGTVGR